MAIKKEIEVEIDYSDIDSLNLAIKEQNDLIFETEKQLKKVQKLYTSIPRGAKENQKQRIAEQKAAKKVVDDTKESLERQIATLIKLQKAKKKQVEANKEISNTVSKQKVDLSSLNDITGGYSGKLQSATKSVKSFNLGLKGTRGAIIATGIGALIVLLGELIANWETITAWFDESAKALNRYNEEMERAGRNQGILDDQIAAIEKQIELLKLTGQEVFELERKRALAILETQKRSKKALDDGLEELKRVEKEATKLTFWQYWFGIGDQTPTDSKQEALLKQRENVAKLRLELEKANLEAEKLSIGLEVELENPKKPTQKQIDAARKAKKDLENKLLAQEDQGAFDTEQEYLLELENYQKFLDEKFNKEMKAFEDSQDQELLDYKIRKKNAKSREDIAKLEFENKQKLLFSTGEAVSALGGIIGEQTAVGKGLAIAGSLINTYASITGQLKAFSGIPVPGYAIAQAVATGLVGFKAVQDIINVEVPNEGAATAAVTPSIPQEPTLPSFNIVGDNPENQLIESINNNDDTLIKAYVVDKDVTSAQELERNKLETASLG